MHEMKIEVVRKTLKRFNGDKTATARVLGLNVRTIRNMVRDNEALKEFKKEKYGTQPRTKSGKFTRQHDVTSTLCKTRDGDNES